MLSGQRSLWGLCLTVSVTEVVWEDMVLAESALPLLGSRHWTPPAKLVPCYCNVDMLHED